MKIKEKIGGLLGNIYLAEESRQDLMRLVSDKSITLWLTEQNSLVHISKGRCQRVFNTCFQTSACRVKMHYLKWSPHNL